MSNISINIPDANFQDDRPTIWGNSYTWAWARSLAQVQKLVIHHSVTVDHATAQDIALLHKARGWAGVGYHIIITRDGVIHYVGDIGTARANVANNNEKVIGICLVGDFRFGKKPSDAQIESLHKLCRYFQTQFPALTKIWDWSDVIGHGETPRYWSGATATICPGDNFRGRADSTFERTRDWKEKGDPGRETAIPDDGLFRVFHGSKQIGAFRRNLIETVKEYEDTLNKAQKEVYGKNSDKKKVGNLKTILRND